MDTKLKSSSNRMIIRAIAFIAAVCCMLASVTNAGIVVHDLGYDGVYTLKDAVNDVSYETSDMFVDDIGTEIYRINSLLRAEFKLDKSKNLTEDNIDLLETDRGNYQKVLNGDQEKGIDYFAAKGNTIVSSKALESEKDAQGALSEIQKYPAYFIYNDGSVSKMPASVDTAYFAEYDMVGMFEDGETVYIAFTQDYLDNQQALFQGTVNDTRAHLLAVLILSVLTLVSLILLLIFTGDRDEEGKIKLNGFDRWFSEIQLMALFGLLFGGGAIYLLLIRWAIWGDTFYMGDEYYETGFGFFRCAVANGFGAVAAIMGLLFIVSIVKKMKAHMFLKTTCIYRIFKPVGNPVKEGAENIRSVYRNFVNGGSVMRKIISLFAGTIFITIFVMWIFSILMGVGFASGFGIVFLTIITMAIVTGLCAKRFVEPVKIYEGIREGVARVKAGEISYKILVEGEGELESMAYDINSITEGFDIAIQNELKSQRLRTELISNVSHDIKTPLTSIITYVDLLKTEGLDSPEASEYLKILEEKALRLNKLTDDLFDAAKASSGALNVNFENVELLSLIHQGLGEMSTKIAGKGLEVLVSGEKEKYIVWADGQLMWRILENMLNNLVKYAEDNSRVYIDLAENGHGEEMKAIMTIKNISKYQLNISTDELMMRFKRGDESRSTDGSGLGLSIARDLAVIQGGTFDIRIDGDLFKVILSLPAVRESMV